MKFLSLLLLAGFLFVNGLLFGQAEKADALFLKGYNYLTADRTQAIQYLSACLDADPNYTNAYYHRGIAHFKDGNYELALKDFDAAYQLNENLDILWMYKGFTYKNMGELDKAVNCFSNYIIAYPTDTTAYSYILRGKMKYELGDFQGAVEDYDLALQLKPFEEKYQYYRFIALYEDGNYAKALKAVTRLTELNPKFYGYYLYKGNVYRKLETYDSAVYMYNVALLKNRSNPDLYYYRGLSYKGMSDCQSAIADFTEAIRMDDDDANLYAERGNCKYFIGDKEGACSDWNKANQLGFYEDFSTFSQRCQ
jgi:tetratricopeptide (TPR) repeat protein